MKETVLNYSSSTGTPITSIHPEHPEYLKWCEEELDIRLRQEKKEKHELNAFLKECKELHLDQSIPGIYEKIPAKHREWFLTEIKERPKSSIIYLFINTLY